MTGSLLLRGMLIGLLAGVVAFFFAYKFGEPQVDRAIAFEAQMSAAEAPAADAVEEPELVSRATQATYGLATGLIVYGTAIGGIFSLVFAFAYGRLGTFGARTTSALLALMAFVTVVLVPQIKYPANPPAVGSDDTIAARTTLFFIILLMSIGATVATLSVLRRLWVSRGGWNAGIIAGVFYLAVISIVYVALPPINEMPEGFAADVVWNFRVSAIGIQLVLWTVIGLGFGVLAERRLEGGAPHRLAHS